MKNKKQKNKKSTFQIEVEAQKPTPPAYVELFEALHQLGYTIEYFNCIGAKYQLEIYPKSR